MKKLYLVLRRVFHEGILFSTAYSYSTEYYQFQATNAQVSPPSDPETIYTLTGSTNIANISADEDYLVYLDTSVPELQILYYDTESLSSAFYYDVGTETCPVSSS